MNEQIEKIKDVGYTLIKAQSLYKIGFWFIIIYLSGLISGVFFAQKIVIDLRLTQAVKMKAMVIDNTVYDLKER